MSDVVISVERLGKKYRIRHQQQQRQSYRTLRDVLTDSTKSFARRLWSAFRSPSNRQSAIGNRQLVEDFWALRNVSFEIKAGESVGLIGYNGAGKSTLLKLLSRITEPTAGRIKPTGRCASLLEVGTGFHPELSGRENIFLNGAVLGMRQAEIRKKFDEIVAFAEVERFLDTPVKRYSSGMYVRLAFAVAAHLEPEILLVDEVLAVGDVTFQRKCLGKMDEVSRSGRTLVFVSHNMSAITRLCQRAILLSSGEVKDDGSSDRVVSGYYSADAGIATERAWADLDHAPGNHLVRMTAVRVYSETGEDSFSHDIRRHIYIETRYRVLADGVKMTPRLHVVNEEGITVFVAQDTDRYWRQQRRTRGMYVSTLEIPGNFLSEGVFSVWLAAVSHNPDEIHFFERNAVSFQVHDPMEGDSARGDYSGPMPGVVRPLLKWTTRLEGPRVKLTADGSAVCGT